MSTLPARPLVTPATTPADLPADSLWRRVRESGRATVGAAVLLAVLLACVGSLPWTVRAPTHGGPDRRMYYDRQDAAAANLAPTWHDGSRLFGTDTIGRSLLARCLLGGAISLGIGVGAAGIAIVIGVSVGLVAGYRGGWVDALLMRAVDVLYGLPYVLMVVLIKVAFEAPLRALLGSTYAANLVVLFVAIGLVSWLTMARVVRGQVLSLRAQPFVEACRAAGLSERRIFARHLLPNLVGPIVVYATLTVPQAILQESFLSFLGIGIQPPLPTWGALASDGLLPALNTVDPRWWLLAFPCMLLAVTLLCLNFAGDGLRDVLDPKRDAGRI